MNIIVIYDDTGKKSEVIADIIGERGFADVVVKKRKLEDYYAESIRKIYPQLIWKKVHSPYEYAQIEKELQNYTEDDTRVIHCFSNYIFSDFEKASLSFRKIEYIKTPYRAASGKKIAAAMFLTWIPITLSVRVLQGEQKPGMQPENWEIPLL